MRRWLVRGGACAAVGGVVTVLLSWASMLWADFPAVPPGMAPVSITNPVWPRPVPADWPAKPQRAIPSSTALLHGWVAEAREPTKIPGRDKIWTQQLIATGWPCPALEAEFQVAGSLGMSTKMEWLGTWKPGFVESLHPLSTDRARLPLRPVWAGLLVDVAVWGLVCYAAVFAWSDVRRWRRVRGGRCVGCGYDLRGLGDGTACPECGSSSMAA